METDTRIAELTMLSKANTDNKAYEASNYEPQKIIGNKEKIELIKETVLEFYGIEWTNVYKRGRHGGLILCRHTIIYFIKKYTPYTLVSIGTLFEGKAEGIPIDHTTVMNAIKKIGDRMDCEKDFKTNMDILETKIRAII